MSADTKDRPAPSQGEILSACVQTLIEHFDSVRIVVTEHSTNETKMISLGAGNLYAQRGSVEEWLDSVLPQEQEDEE